MARRSAGFANGKIVAIFNDFSRSEMCKKRPINNEKITVQGEIGRGGSVNLVFIEKERVTKNGTFENTYMSIQEREST